MDPFFVKSVDSSTQLIQILPVFVKKKGGGNETCDNAGKLKSNHDYLNHENPIFLISIVY
jgi:hypothetical protein